MRLLIPRNSNRPGDLGDYLIKPIKRIFQYELLLKEVDKNVALSNSLKQRLLDILDRFRSVAAECNNQAVRKENARALLAIQVLLSFLF